MILLLDTHVWLWAVEAPEKLGRHARTLLQKASNDRLVSAISVLEIARLCMDQSIIFSISPKTWIEASARDLQLQHLDVISRAKPLASSRFGVHRPPTTDLKPISHPF
jgi:PIN domain nuclease of toxin-antitoxin system